METSKRRLEIKFDPDLLAALRSCTKAERKEIGDLIERVRESFGNPHAHAGTGIRALGQGLYECRHGLSLRLIFAAYSGMLYFHAIGDHEAVRRFLRAHR
jgi:hypothetical protein